MGRLRLLGRLLGLLGLLLAHVVNMIYVVLVLGRFKSCLLSLGRILNFVEAGHGSVGSVGRGDGRGGSGREVGAPSGGIYGPVMGARVASGQCVRADRTR